MIKRKMVLLFSLSLSLISCKGADGGFAPSAISAPPLKTSPSTPSSLKFGSAVKTTNGWNLQIDTSDPIKNLTTANGWKVEVKYE